MAEANRTKKGRKILYGIIIFFLVIILGGAAYLSTLLPIVTGYAAKNMGSDVFISGRMPEDIDSVDLNFSVIKFTKNNVNFDDSTVTSRFLWGRSRSVYRDGFGVTLLRRTSETRLKEIKFPEIPLPGYSSDTTAWPLGDLLPDTATGINTEALASISRRLVDENGYGGNAFAFMVLHKGVPVAEAYKPRFNKDTRFLSWSMAKSFINAMLGVLVNEDGIDINMPTGLEEWQNDERRNITFNDLMQMKSGLEWNEDYGSRSDVNLMLFCRKDMAAYVAGQKLKYPVGSYWEYSSGSSNILSYLIRKHLGNDSAYYAFPYSHLFHKIGITDAVFETDPSGTFIGSSYIYATARDYARFALLYQQDGVFNGERLFPEGWVKYTREPVPASNGEYGSLFWLHEQGEVPSAPSDIYMCVGHDGQKVMILPTQELIVVVLGYSPKGCMNFDRLLKDIIGTL